MDEQFLKDKITNDDIQVPDSLLPENIGKLINKAEAKKTCRKKIGGKQNSYMGWIFGFAGAAAAVLMLILAINVTGIGKGQGKGENIANNGIVTYEDVYRQIDGGIWGRIKNDIDTALYGKVEYTITESATMAAELTYDSSLQADSAIKDEAAGSTGNYSRTNTQEAEVGEGDIFVTDGSYIYILKNSGKYSNNGEIIIAQTEGEKVTVTADFHPEVVSGYDILSFEEIYVQGNRLAVVGTAYRNTYEKNNDDEITFAAIYDISDRSNPVLMNTAKQSGGFVSSRQSGGVIYLVSEFDRLVDISRREYDSYIPACDGQIVEPGSIYCPEELSYRGYTVIGSIDFNNPEGYIDSESVMAGSSNMYVSADAIYFLIRTGNIKTYKTLGGTLYGKGMSSLVKFSYDNGNIEYVNTAEVPGNADSQFSFSEYNGYIRLVTTASEYIQYEDTDEAGRTDSDEWDNKSSAVVYGSISNGLYIFDKDLNPVGSIDNLAEGEFLKSSRFLGDMAYFVTFRQTDPLFTVDLSDPANPVITNELKVTGFSEYLHPYADGKMLGIGYEADPDTGAMGYLKLSMFDISDSGDVTEENRLVLNGAYSSGALYNHRAVMVDAGRGIFGFASDFDFYTEGSGSGEGTLYQLFAYDENEGFKILLSCRVDAGRTVNYYYYGTETTRAVYIDDYLYIYDGENLIYIYDLTNYSFVKKIEL